MQRGLTLVEVMLALVIISIGVLAGVEMMGHVVRAEAEQRAWSTWEDRVMKAREVIQELDLLSNFIAPPLS